MMARPNHHISIVSMTHRKRPRVLVHLLLRHEELVDFMREHSHLYPQAAAQVRAVVEETKNCSRTGGVDVEPAKIGHE